jgi:Outer membrane protein beta-barrel domain
MFGKRLWVAVLFVVITMGASSVAQDEKNELGGILGRTFISDQAINVASAFSPAVIRTGNGLSFEVEYARRFLVTPIFSLSGEAVLMYNHDEDVNNGTSSLSLVPPQYSELFVTPAARVNLFPASAVSPWISLGAGFGHIGQGSSLIFGGANPGKSTTSGVVEGGLGLDVKVWRKLSIRAEVRDFWSGEPDFPLAPTGKSRQHNYFVGGGAFWRF